MLLKFQIITSSLKNQWVNDCIDCNWNNNSNSHCNSVCITGKFSGFIQWSDTVGQQEGHPDRKKTGCWFVVGDDLTGALHVL